MIIEAKLITGKRTISRSISYTQNDLWENISPGGHFLKYKVFLLKNESVYYNRPVIMKSLLTFIAFVLGVYLLICFLLYFFQEKMIFFPETLEKDFSFGFRNNFEERYIRMEDDIKLHALLFRSPDAKGVVFYLHGNAGSLEDWGIVAETFTSQSYDVFIPDYRGYGKSEGTITNEAQLHRDMQTLYDHIKEDYPEHRLSVLGHSIGSGMAARVAAVNSPKLLILQAPPYSLPDLVRNTFPLQVFPTFLLKYKLETGKYIREAEMPVVVLHGDKDEVVYYGSSLKLQENFKPEDTLITLHGLGHNNFLVTPQYRNEIQKILERHEN